MASYIARRKILSRARRRGGFAARGARAHSTKVPTIGFLDATTTSIQGQWAAASVHPT
jgi:hypothetical protein